MSAVAGILLAGGASRRFGADKRLTLVDGEPLFYRPLRALAETCDEVVIVLAPSAAELPVPATPAPVRFVHDPVAHEGPLVGVRAGLGAVTAPLAVVAGADMPGLLPALVQLLADRLGKSERAAIALADAEGQRPLPLALRTGPAIATADALISAGERRLRALVGALDAERVIEREWASADPRGAWREDVDVPRDLER